RLRLLLSADGRMHLVVGVEEDQGCVTATIPVTCRKRFFPPYFPKWSIPAILVLGGRAPARGLRGARRGARLSPGSCRPEGACWPLPPRRVSGPAAPRNRRARTVAPRQRRPRSRRRGAWSWRAPREPRLPLHTAAGGGGKAGCVGARSRWNAGLIKSPAGPRYAPCRHPG